MKFVLYRSKEAKRGGVGTHEMMGWWEGDEASGRGMIRYFVELGPVK